MKDNTITTADGIEVYKHNINYYADEYIRNELEIDHVDTDSKQIVKDNFVDMLFYICDHIENSEAADYKKKWKEASSEQERKAIEEAEHKAQVDEELKTLRRENKVSKYEKQYLSQKYDAKDALEIAEALYDGDMDTVFKIQQRHEEELKKGIKAEIMKDMPTPPSGNQTKIDYSKQIAEAQERGDMVAVASLIRRQSEENSNK